MSSISGVNDDRMIKRKSFSEQMGLWLELDQTKLTTHAVLSARETNQTTAEQPKQNKACWSETDLSQTRKLNFP